MLVTFASTRDRAGDVMSRGERGRLDDAVVAEHVRLAREEYAEEEAEAAELEAAQNAAALEVHPPT
jgi:hypothetical protein